MIKMEIGFWGMESILEFVSITGSCKERMSLVCGENIVNAKSLLSVLSLKTTEGVELIIHEDSCGAALKRLELYIEHGRLLHGGEVAV